jgi:hypothetical protein
VLSAAGQDGWAAVRWGVPAGALQQRRTPDGSGGPGGGGQQRSASPPWRSS